MNEDDDDNSIQFLFINVQKLTAQGPVTELARVR
jgi:hypothetical protein